MLYIAAKNLSDFDHVDKTQSYGFQPTTAEFSIQPYEYAILKCQNKEGHTDPLAMDPDTNWNSVVKKEHNTEYVIVQCLQVKDSMKGSLTPAQEFYDKEYDF